MTVTADSLGEWRGPLRAFCYQLLGSPFDADDAVQDTLERAWRSRETFDPDVGPLRSWLFRIARNVCFDRLRERPRRPLPRDLRDPGIESGAPLVPAPDVPWLLPAPTSWWEDSLPEAAVVRADDVRIATEVVLQTMSARQRGVFILREVLGLSAAECAGILGMTVAGANSALQRARAALRDRAGVEHNVVGREVVNAYARAIEGGDVATLASLVSSDVLFEMPPVPQWSIGRDPYLQFMTGLFLQRGTDWATRVVSANGQPGILLYLRESGVRVAHTLHVLDRGDRDTVGHILVYRDDRLFALFESDGRDDVRVAGT